MEVLPSSTLAIAASATAVAAGQTKTKKAEGSGANHSSSVFTDTVSFLPLPDFSLPYWDTVLVIGKPTPSAHSSRIFTDLYSSHALKPRHTQSIQREAGSPEWMFPVLLTMLAVFTGLRIFYSRYFRQMVASLFNINLANQLVRDENVLVQRATVYMSIMFYLTAGLFLYHLSEYRQWDLPWFGTGFPRYLKFIVLVSAVYAVKFVVLRVCGWLFELERELTTYLFTVFIVNNVQGMILFPIIVLLSYHPLIEVSWLFSLAFVVITVLYIFRLFRGIQIGLGVHRTSLLYLFLYLCTLELAPLLVVYRIASAS